MWGGGQGVDGGGRVFSKTRVGGRNYTIGDRPGVRVVYINNNGWVDWGGGWRHFDYPLTILVQGLM